MERVIDIVPSILQMTYWSFLKVPILRLVDDEPVMRHSTKNINKIIQNITKSDIDYIDFSSQKNKKGSGDRNNNIF